MNFAAIDWLSISINLLLVVFVIVCLLMTLLILMQRPKQEGLGAAFGAGVTDVYLVKTDATGGEVWAKVWGDTMEDGGSSVRQTADSGYIIAGYTGSSGAGGHDVWLIKTNAQGGTDWTRTYGGQSGDQGNSVAPTADGGYIIAGYTWSFGAGNADVYLIKTDAAGDVIFLTSQIG